MIQRTLSILLLISLYACHSKPNQDEQFRLHLNKIISSVDSTQQFNGVVGVLRKDKQALILYHGYESPIDKHKQLDSTAYFYLASNSKLFTGFSAIKMMEKYGLQPEDSIAPYFPELHPKLRKVTIQQLANHTCAIHDYFSLVGESPTLNNEKVIQLISQLDSTVYEPGLKWGYTNSGYVLLSLLIERVTKEAYNNFLNREVLGPLGMEGTQFHPNAIHALQGYENNKKNPMASITTGDAGLYATSTQLMRFLKNQEQLSSYIQQAKTWSSPWKDDQWRYGFGWFFSKDEMGEFRAHSGQSSGFESYIRIYDSNELMLFILSNNKNGSAQLLRKKLIKEISVFNNNKNDSN